MIVPGKDEIRQARNRVRMTQARAAYIVHATADNWRRWESGKHQIPLSAWELFLIKTDQRDLYY